MTACHDMTHGPTGSEVLPKLHHHTKDGGRVGHARFGPCVMCASGWPLYDAPTPDMQPDLFTDEKETP